MSLYRIDDKSQIDEFGVDLSNFSLNDELTYNVQRAKEKELQKIDTKLINRKKSHWDGVGLAAITGVGEGMIGGIERLANGITNGVYGKILDTNFDNAYTNRQNKLQNRADSNNLGNINRMANTTIDVSGYLMPYVYGLGKILK